MKLLPLLFLILMSIVQAAGAYDLALTLEIDKTVYQLDEVASFTGRLKNVSQETITVTTDVEFRFTVVDSGIEVWGWSHLECG